MLGSLKERIMEREFLIHSLPTSTEVARFRTLLTEYEDILDKIYRNGRRISNEDKIQLQMLRESIQEMIGSEDLKERVYFDIRKVKGKVESILGRN